jgi:hypothetical protein
MMSRTLLEQFLAEECTPYVRDLARSGLEVGRSGTGPRKRRFELNRFEITVDLDEDDVLIEDVLDASNAGAQRVSTAELSAALTKHQLR